MRLPCTLYPAPSPITLTGCALHPHPAPSPWQDALSCTITLHPASSPITLTGCAYPLSCIYTAGTGCWRPLPTLPSTLPSTAGTGRMRLPCAHHPAPSPCTHTLTHRTGRMRYPHWLPLLQVQAGLRLPCAHHPAPWQDAPTIYTASAAGTGRVAPTLHPAPTPCTLTHRTGRVAPTQHPAPSPWQDALSCTLHLHCRYRRPLPSTLQVQAGCVIITGCIYRCRQDAGVHYHLHSAYTAPTLQVQAGCVILTGCAAGTGRVAPTHHPDA